MTISIVLAVDYRKGMTEQHKSVLVWEQMHFADMHNNLFTLH